MQIVPSKTKELMLVMSPDTYDRGTERPFVSLFEKEMELVIPPRFLSESDVNPVPHKDSVLLFEGGTDVNPELYHQPLGPRTQAPDSQRDVHEQHYFKMAQAVGAACVGVCRGAQFLCVMSGGSLIQDVGGHEKTHALVLPDKYKRFTFVTTSSHHQLMNPYVLPRPEWLSFGTAPSGIGGRYRDGNNHKVKVYKKWKDWKDQEIVWFKKTRCLAIQGHPEWFKDPEAAFVLYCRFLLDFLILNPKSPIKETPDEIQTP